MVNVCHGTSLMQQFLGLLFFIYTNDLIEHLQSTQNVFADNTSLFTITNDPNARAKQICGDLASLMLDILLKRQLLQNHLILNLATMKSKRL